MEFVKPGKFVELAYDLYEVDGENEVKMVGFSKEHPDRIVFGVDDSVIPAFCDAIEGKTVGDTFDITLSPKDAFGPRREEHVMELDRELFNDEDGKFDEKHVYDGAAITMMTAEGYPVSGLVLSVTPLKVKIDFNHPLAGKTVHYKGEILLVRDATEAELHPSCGGGCGFRAHRAPTSGIPQCGWRRGGAPHRALCIRRWRDLRQSRRGGGPE